MSARPIHLVPSLCHICDMSLFKNDARLKREMPLRLGMSPADREEKHAEMAERLRVSLGALSVTKKRVKARYIGMGAMEMRVADGSWAHTSITPHVGKYRNSDAKIFMESTKLLRLVVLYGGHRDNRNVEDFMRLMDQKAQARVRAGGPHGTVSPATSRDALLLWMCVCVCVCLCLQGLRLPSGDAREHVFVDSRSTGDISRRLNDAMRGLDRKENAVLVLAMLPVGNEEAVRACALLGEARVGHQVIPGAVCACACVFGCRSGTTR